MQMELGCNFLDLDGCGMQISGLDVFEIGPGWS